MQGTDDFAALHACCLLAITLLHEWQHCCWAAEAPIRFSWHSAHAAAFQQDHEQPRTLERPETGKVSCSQMGHIGSTHADVGLQVWSETFEKWLGPIPKALHGPCCAEFIVSRERIEAHPRCSSHFTVSASALAAYLACAGNESEDIRMSGVGIQGSALFWSQKGISYHVAVL